MRQESSQVDKYEGGRKSDHFSTFLPPSFSLLFLRMKDDEDKRGSSSGILSKDKRWSVKEGKYFTEG